MRSLNPRRNLLGFFKISFHWGEFWLLLVPPKFSLEYLWDTFEVHDLSHQDRRKELIVKEEFYIINYIPRRVYLFTGRHQRSRVNCELCPAHSWHWEVWRSEGQDRDILETSDVQYWQPSCPRRSQEGVTRRGPHAVTPYQDASSRAVMSRCIVFLSVGNWRVLAVNCEVVALGYCDIEAVS